MNWIRLISKILENMSKNTINEKVITLNYFLLYLDQQDVFQEYFQFSLDEFKSYEEFRFRFHKGLRQIDPFNNSFLEMTLHSFLNQNIFLFEEALKFSYWLNQNEPSINSVEEAINSYYFDYGI